MDEVGEERMNAKEKATKYLQDTLGLPNYPNRLIIFKAIDLALAERDKEWQKKVEEIIRDIENYGMCFEIDNEDWVRLKRKWVRKE